MTNGETRAEEEKGGDKKDSIINLKILTAWEQKKEEKCHFRFGLLSHVIPSVFTEANWCISFLSMHKCPYPGAPFRKISSGADGKKKSFQLIKKPSIIL